MRRLEEVARMACAQVGFEFLGQLGENRYAAALATFGVGNHHDLLVEEKIFDGDAYKL
jgi:hypothetical protein